MEIPLSGGAENAHQVVEVQLGDYLVTLTLDYLQSGSWNCDIAVDGTDVTYGILLEPNCDLLEYYDLGIGSLVMAGEDTTLDNLGAANALVWISPDE
jgi:hypothetical protein